MHRFYGAYFALDVSRLLFFALDELLEVLYRFLQSFFELDLGLPAGELLVGDFYVRAALGGVVGRERHVYDV